MQDVDRCKDSRWVHRPKFPEQRFKDAQDPDTQAGQLFSRLKHLITVRKQADELGTSFQYESGMWQSLVLTTNSS